MHLPQIRCYNSAAILNPHVFFVLSKGPNAGQPSFKPWTNCFQVVCTNNNWFDFYFWLCYGLFKAEKFKTYHRGSVIPFINKGDLRELICDFAPAIYPHWDQYQKIIQALSKLEQKKATLAEQIIATEKLQSHLIRAYFN
jgi:hypothetical protein